MIDFLPVVSFADIFSSSIVIHVNLFSCHLWIKFMPVYCTFQLGAWSLKSSHDQQLSCITLTATLLVAIICTDGLFYVRIKATCWAKFQQPGSVCSWLKQSNPSIKNSEGDVGNSTFHPVSQQQQVTTLNGLVEATWYTKGITCVGYSLHSRAKSNNIYIYLSSDTE